MADFTGFYYGDWVGDGVALDEADGVAEEFVAVFYLGYKNGRTIIERIPYDRVLTETDAPYNEKCNLSRLLEELAKIWNVTFNDAEAIIERNFRTLLLGVK